MYGVAQGSNKKALVHHTFAISGAYFINSKNIVEVRVCSRKLFNTNVIGYFTNKMTA